MESRAQAFTITRENLVKLAEEFCYDYGRFQCIYSVSEANARFWGCGQNSEDPAKATNARNVCTGLTALTGSERLKDQTGMQLIDVVQQYEKGKYDVHQALALTTLSLAQHAVFDRFYQKAKEPDKSIRYLYALARSVAEKGDFAILRNTACSHGEFNELHEAFSSFHEGQPDKTAAQAMEQYKNHVDTLQGYLRDTYEKIWKSELLDYELVTEDFTPTPDSNSFLRFFWVVALSWSVAIGDEFTNKTNAWAQNDLFSQASALKERTGIHALTLDPQYYRWTSFQSTLAQWTTGKSSIAGYKAETTSVMETKIQQRFPCNQILEASGDYTLPSEMPFLENGTIRNGAKEVGTEYAAFIFVCATNHEDGAKVVVKPSTLLFDPENLSERYRIFVVNVSPWPVDVNYDALDIRFGLYNEGIATRWEYSPIASAVSSAFLSNAFYHPADPVTLQAVVLPAEFQYAMWIPIPASLFPKFDGPQKTFAADVYFDISPENAPETLDDSWTSSSVTINLQAESP